MTNSQLSHPILWSFRRCPYAMRARMAIKTSGQIVHLREILLRQKPQEFLTDSQKGTVPVLKLENGSVIDESLDVMHWALNINDPMNLKGVLDEEPVYSKSFLKTLDHDFKNSLDRYKYSNRYQGGGDQKLHHRDVGEKFLESIEKRLTSKNSCNHACTRFQGRVSNQFGSAIRNCRINGPPATSRKPKLSPDMNALEVSRFSILSRNFSPTSRWCNF